MPKAESRPIQMPIHAERGYRKIYLCDQNGWHVADLQFAPFVSKKDRATVSEFIVEAVGRKPETEK